MNAAPLPTIGTVLQFAPAAGNVHLTWNDGTKDSAPLIGYVVIVTHASHDRNEYETSVEPLFLAPEDGMPATISDIRLWSASGLFFTWTVTPT